MLLATIGVILVTLWVLQTVRLLYKMRPYSHLPHPPLPRGPTWYFGHSSLFKKKRELGTNSLNDVFESIRSDLEVENFVLFFYVPFSTFFNPIFYTANLDVNSKVLSDHKTFLKRDPKTAFLNVVDGNRVLGDKSILQDKGTELWTNKRRIMDPAFKKKFLRQIMGKMELTAETMVNFIKDQPRKEDFNIFPLMCRSALEVVCTCGFNLHDDFIHLEDSKINNSVTDLFELIQLYIVNNLAFKLPWTYRKEKAALKSTNDYMRSLMRDQLQHRFDAIQAGTDEKDDLLSYIIKGNTFTDALTMEDLIDDFYTFLIAGMETTALTMTCLVWEVVKNQHVYDRLMEEIRGVYRGRETVEYDDLSELVYLEQIIKETLRIHSPVQGTFRVSPTNRTVTIEGLTLPPKTDIYVSIQVPQTSEKYWDRPAVFDPDRFGAGKQITPFTFMPFTAGPRICIGKHFAMMEMKVLLSKLFHDLQLSDARPGESVLEKVPSLTLKPKHGVFVNVQCD